jgi:hypothetical protein
MRSLVCVECAVACQILFSAPIAAWAFRMRDTISFSVPPVLSIMLPRHANCATLSIVSLCIQTPYNLGKCQRRHVTHCRPAETTGRTAPRRQFVLLVKSFQTITFHEGTPGSSDIYLYSFFNSGAGWSGWSTPFLGRCAPRDRLVTHFT